MASATEEFKIFTNFDLNANGHIKLVTTILDRSALCLFAQLPVKTYINVHKLS